MSELLQIPADKLHTLAITIKDNIAISEVATGYYKEQIRDGRKLFNPIQERNYKPFTGATELHVPIVKKTRNGLSSRTYKTLFGVSPIFGVEAVIESQKPNAAEFEKFLQELLVEECRFNLVMRSAFDNSFKDGTQAIYTKWKKEYQNVTRWQADAFGNIDAVTQEELVYDYPEFELLDVFDFGVYPATVGDIQKSAGVFVKFSKNGRELLQGVDMGDYDKDAVYSLFSFSGDMETTISEDESDRNISNQATLEKDFNSARFDICECYWRYSGDDKKIADDYLITLHLPSNTVLRCIKNPWWHGLRPIELIRPYADVFGIYADSLPDMVGDAQRALTASIRLSLDLLAMQVCPPIAVNRNENQDEQFKDDEGLHPGQYVLLHDVNNVTPLNVANVSASSILPIQEYISRVAEEMTGIGANQLGIKSQGNTTATEAEIMNSEGAEQFAMIIQRFSDSLKNIAKLVQELCYQFSGNQMIQELWQRVGNTTNITETLGMKFKINPAGATETTNKAVKLNQAKALYDIFMQNPVVANDPEKIYQISVMLANAFDVKDPSSFLGTEQEIKDLIEESKRLEAEKQAQAEAEAEKQRQMAGGV